MEENTFGAPVEYGSVTEKTEAGYRVASMSRPGLITPILPAAPGMEADVGNSVAFFLFENGKGAVLMKISG